jgi:hypothetical protein
MENFFPALVYLRYGGNEDRQECLSYLLWRAEFSFSFQRISKRAARNVSNLNRLIKFLYRFGVVLQESVNPAHRFMRSRDQGAISFW